MLRVGACTDNIDDYITKVTVEAKHKALYSETVWEKQQMHRTPKKGYFHYCSYYFWEIRVNEL